MHQGWKPLLSYICTFHMLTFFVIQFCATLCRGGQERGTLNLYAVYAFDLGPERLGLLNTVAIAFVLPVPFLTGYLMDRFGRRAVIVPGFTVYELAVILMSLTAFLPTPVTFFLVTYVLVLATQGTTGGVMQVLGTDLAPAFAPAVLRHLAANRAAGVDGDSCDLRGHRRAHGVWVRVPLPGGLRAGGGTGRGDGAGGHARTA